MAIMSDIALSAKGVSKSYQTQKGHLTALDKVDLDIARGEFVSLIGPSGCGKSTLLYILGGLRKQTSGEVLLDGQVVKAPVPTKVGFVFQDYTLFPWRTIIANVEAGLEFRGVNKAERRARAAAQLELVGLGAFADSYPGELSGGMQQRVAIARALAMEPDVLLMDEPFGALDEQTRTVLGMELAKILGDTGKTIVFVTHSLGEAVFLSDRVVVMSARPGRIKEILTVDEPHPRTPDFAISAGFNTVRNHLFELLHEEVQAASLRELSGKSGAEVVTNAQT